MAVERIATGNARRPWPTPSRPTTCVEHRTALLGIVIEDAMQVVGREGVGQGLRAFPAIRSTAILRGLRQAAGFWANLGFLAR